MSLRDFGEGKVLQNEVQRIDPELEHFKIDSETLETLEQFAVDSESYTELVRFCALLSKLREEGLSDGELEEFQQRFCTIQENISKKLKNVQEQLAAFDEPDKNPFADLRNTGKEVLDRQRLALAVASAKLSAENWIVDGAVGRRESARQKEIQEKEDREKFAAGLVHAKVDAKVLYEVMEVVSPESTKSFIVERSRDILEEHRQELSRDALLARMPKSARLQAMIDFLVDPKKVATLVVGGLQDAQRRFIDQEELELGAFFDTEKARLEKERLTRILGQSDAVSKLAEMMKDRSVSIDAVAEQIVERRRSEGEKDVTLREALLLPDQIMDRIVADLTVEQMQRFSNPNQYPNKIFYSEAFSRRQSEMSRDVSSLGREDWDASRRRNKLKGELEAVLKKFDTLPEETRIFDEGGIFLAKKFLGLREKWTSLENTQEGQNQMQKEVAEFKLRTDSFAVNVEDLKKGIQKIFKGDVLQGDWGTLIQEEFARYAKEVDASICPDIVPKALTGVSAAEWLRQQAESFYREVEIASNTVNKKVEEARARFEGRYMQTQGEFEIFEKKVKGDGLDYRHGLVNVLKMNRDIIERGIYRESEIQRILKENKKIWWVPLIDRTFLILKGDGSTEPITVNHDQFLLHTRSMKEELKKAIESKAQAELLFEKFKAELEAAIIDIKAKHRACIDEMQRLRAYPTEITRITQRFEEQMSYIATKLSSMGIPMDGAFHS
jgi:hypothetical protein